MPTEELEPEQIEAQLAVVCGQLNAAQARLVELVAAVLETGCWSVTGIHSCEQWVAWKTGLSPARAHDLVVLAGRHGELPETARALADGELSVDQAAVVARHTPAEYESDVVAFAKLTTVAQLRRTLSRYRFQDPASDADPSAAVDPPDATARTGVSGWFDQAGLYRLRAVLDADDGAVVDAALREARDALFRAGDTDVTWSGALVEVAARSLGGAAPVPRRDLFTAYLHVPLGTPETPGHLHCGPVLPDAVRRQLLCDARGAVVGIRDGRPVDVGRTRRIVPTHTRRLIEDRDRGCRVPGCTNTRVQIHHLVHWEDGGATDAANLLALCHRHHRLHHRQQLRITGDPRSADGLRFADARGRPLASGPPPIGTPARASATAAVQDGDVAGRWLHPPGERLDSHWIHFNRQPRAG